MQAMYVIVRGGIRLVVSLDVAREIEKAVQAGSKTILIGDSLINPVEIVGIFKPSVIEAMENRRRGMWLAGDGNWYTKQEKAHLRPAIVHNTEEIKLIESKNE